jgi:hypothetical protein
MVGTVIGLAGAWAAAKVVKRETTMGNLTLGPNVVHIVAYVPERLPDDHSIQVVIEL